MRWRDDIQKHANTNWIQTAQDRLYGRQLEEAYVQEWRKMGYYEGRYSAIYFNV